MDKDQIDIITQYLKIETNYAVIINGKYGVGKTHFYKNKLAPSIKAVPLPKDDRKHFIPIHISLFGFKSLEEIQSAIFVELFPILKSKKLKLAAGIGKSIIRGILQINQAGNIDEYIGDISQDVDEWLKYDELVICFDDLDRKSEALPLKDVFGFINSLVENQNAKVVIIANEHQLIKDQTYSADLREKVIGVSIHYRPNATNVFNEIILSRYSSSDKVYFDFLSRNNTSIIPIIEVNQNNFRNLIFFLEHFKIIYAPIENAFQEDSNFALLKPEKLDAVLDFTLAITIEYKMGHLNSTNLEDFSVSENDRKKIDINDFLEKIKSEPNGEVEGKSAFIDIFKRKYYLNKTYYFFNSIFNYITGVQSFSVDDLKSELNSYFIATSKGYISEQDKILSRLKYLDCLNLTDKEYKKLTVNMLKHVDTGSFALSQYVTVFHYATRFENLLNFDIVKLKERFRSGINRGKSNYSYSAKLGFQMSIGSSTEFKSDVKEIIEYCLKMNDSLKASKSESGLKQIFTLFLTNFKDFIERVDERENDYRYSAFWIEFDQGKVLKRIFKLENEEIWSLANYFLERYRKHIFEGLYPEKRFVSDLKKSLTAINKKRRKSLKNASLNYLVKCLQDSEANFPQPAASL